MIDRTTIIAEILQDVAKVSASCAVAIGNIVMVLAEMGIITDPSQLNESFAGMTEGLTRLKERIDFYSALSDRKENSDENDHDHP